MKYRIFIILSFFLFSCISEDIVFPNSNSEINIYLVKQTDTKYLNENIDLDDLQLDAVPWLKSSEIKFYDWSAHIFYLNTEKEKEKYAARNFVVKAEYKNQIKSESLFMGVFFPMYLSSIPSIPSILASDNLFFPDDIIYFNQFGLNGGEMNKQTKFKQALIDADLYREGIDVEMVKLERKNASTLNYTFRVTNNDKESIYVLDPNKMGEGRFHYFTNGVSLNTGQAYYSAENQSIQVSEIESRWYYKLIPQQSMERTVTLSGFSNLPTGNVHFRFSFPGAKVKKGEWQKIDGRIWLGDKYIQGDLTL